MERIKKESVSDTKEGVLEQNFKIKRMEEEMILNNIRSKRNNEILLKKIANGVNKRNKAITDFVKKSRADIKEEIKVIEENMVAENINNKKAIKKAVDSLNNKFNSIIILSYGLIASNFIIFLYLISTSFYK